eukprot:scaffold87513_cov43-Attheya_sp.AAC.1
MAVSATAMACSAACGICCCWCKSLCGDGMTFEELIKSPPETAEVKEFMEQLQPKADLDGEPDVCCCCLPKAVVCCLPRCCCPCICPRPDPVSTVKTRDVVELSASNNSRSFLGEERAIKYAARLFKSAEASECRLEYMTAGMVLLSVGSMQEKMQALFQSFAFDDGGVFTKDDLVKTLRSLLKTVIDIAEHVAEYLSTAFPPGGKAIKLMLAALNGTVGSFFVNNRVNKMLKRDLDGDGAIDYEEFEQASMRRDSLIRKTLAWVASKTAIMRGQKEKELSGRLVIDNKSVWAVVPETEFDADQCLEFWDTGSDLKARKLENRLGAISLKEPCSIDDGIDEKDTQFIILDSMKKRWTIQCSDMDSFYEWFDAVDDRCDAKLEDRDLENDEQDGPDLCPSVKKLGKMLR